MKKILFPTFIVIFLLASALLFADEPGFKHELKTPSSFIAPYPEIEQKSIIRIFSFEPYYTTPLSRLIQHRSSVKRSSFEDKSLTFGATYYNKGTYKYYYTSRTANANAFYNYREKELLKKQLGQIRASALSKRQQDKAGGLLSLNIPIKSKTFEDIFGEGGAGLKVSGYHRISFSGRSQWTDQVSTATNKQSKFPALNMEQISRFDINGTIGSKITVSVSQDSKTDTPLANRLILRYKGDEDDVLQTIEAGNTNLSLPNTKFVGYSQRIRGLFGVKATAKVGGLSLTAIASQEKGNSERTTFEPGTGATMKTIRDYQYAYGRIFDLGRLPVNCEECESNDFDFYPYDTILSIQVYKNAKIGANIDYAAPEADFYVDLDDTTNYDIENGHTHVTEIDPSEYTINPTEHWILFRSANGGSTDGLLGYFMTVRRANGDTVTIGNVTDDIYTLKLIRNNSPLESFVTWSYEWRNVYSLQATNIELEGLEINVFKGGANTESTGDNIDHQNGTKYIQILGLDRTSTSGGANPDNLVDIYNPSVVFQAGGLLIFPDRQPFASENVFGDAQPLTEKVPEIYSNVYGNTEITTNTAYYLQVSNLSRQAEISLNKPNIIENSERITLNGVELVRGEDYRINYDFGRITFDHPDATDPNADISIDFEYTPFITAQKKSLFGIRGEYEFSKNLKLGTTFLYKSDKATERKPKVGQETSRAYVWDADISFKVSPGFFTSMVDAIPFYKTDAKSNLQVSAEVAQSYPNPNVDGVAYIDDFEGSRDSYSMGIFRESWTKASRPVGLDDDYYRSRMIWYNPYVQVPTSQIWEREVRAGESGSHTLRVEFTPHPSDTLIEVVDPVTSDTTEIFPNSWTGIMRSMSAGAINQERAQLLEFRVMGTQGIMHVELGAISEDVNGNGETDTEDKVDPISKMTDGIVDKDEDLGLDGLADIEEPGYNSETNPDPAGDNWWYNGYGDVKCDECTDDPNDYRFINGTQGNRNDPNRYGKPDTEDLDRGGDNDRQNAYFSYEVDLADDRFLVEGSNYNGWRTFRIPVRDPDALDMVYSQLADADWARINYIRLWFEAPDEQPFTISIAAADIIQSNWEDTLAILAQNEFVSPQSKFVVAAINNQENDDYKLDPPPGVTGFYDKTADIVEPEQSLLLKYENLNPGDTCIATRLFYDTPSYVGYRKLNMLVHGPADVDSIMFFFRLGDAEDRYYEYQTILKPGWHPDNEVNIDFNEITILKEYLLQAQAENPDTNEIIDGNYRVWGNPTLTRVKFLAVGVVNISKKNAAYYHPTGDIWINELKLLEVRRDVGMAARVAVSGNMADLFTYRANYEYQNSYFQKLSSSSGSGANLGSGKTSTTYSTGVSLNLNKLLPRSLGASIPISVSYSKRTIVPRLKTNSDIVLPPELQEEESTISESRSFSISESFSLKTRNPLFTLLVNPLKTSFSYSRVEGRSPQRPSSFTETYHIKGSHSFKFSKVPGIKPLFWTSPVPIIKKLSETKFYFFPKSITSSGNFDRNLSISENSSGVVSQTLKRTFVGDMKFVYDISNNLKSNFSMNTKRDLNDPDKIKITLNPKTFKFGRETSYSQRFGATYGLSLFSFLSHNFIYSADYRESRDVRDSTRNINSTKSYGVNGSFEHQKLFNFGLVKKDDSRSNRKRRGRRAPIKKDSIVVEVKEHKSLKVRILTPVSKVLTALTSWLRPIGYEFSERYSYAYTGVTERAKFAFQFGFSDEIGVPVKSSMTGSTRSTSVTKATNYSFRTGTIFFGGLKTDISFSRKINQDIIKTTNRNKVVATTFPDISFTINELRTFKFLNPFIRKFRPRTAFSRSVDKSYNLQTGFQTTEKSSIRQNPILGLSANVLGGVQLTFSTDRSVSESKSLNSQNGSISSRSRSTLTNTTFSIKYSFSSPRGIKLPLFGRLKFKSNLSLSTDISFRKKIDERAANDGGYGETGNETNFMVSPSMQYSFSSQINGGLTGKWQTTNNVAQKKKSNIRELRIWVEIKF